MSSAISGSPTVSRIARNVRKAAAIPRASARKLPTRVSSARSWNTPRAPQNPAIRPITAATGAKKAASGVAPPGTGRSDQMRFASRPVRAPAHGPARTPTSTVPIESRYTGSLRK